MDMQLVLENVGLSGNEARVYVALLELGSALAGAITRKSGVNRTNVYDALERLIEKGLASYVIQANRKYFEVGSPDKILKFLEQREFELASKKALVQSALSEFEERRLLNKEPQEATIYKGKKGLISIAENILETKREMLVFGAEGKFVELFTHYAEQWHMRRGKLKIPLKIIYHEKVRAIKLKANFPVAEMRFHSYLYETPATTWIYGDKVAIIVWSDQPLATLIRSKEVAGSYRQFFQVLWKDSKK